VSCASPDYLAKYGEPLSIDALSTHRAVNYLSSATGKAVPLEFMVAGSATATHMQPDATVSVTGAELYTAAAIAGLGIVQVPRYRVVDELASGRLKMILPDTPPPPLPVSVLYLQNRQLSARVRVFAQWLRSLFETANV